MKVFVTGASGFIGSAVVRELIESGHQVLGLARSDAAAAKIASAGAEVHRGSLDDLDSLRSGAASSDGVIHLAFVHDFSDYEGSARTDLRAVQTIGAVLEGSGKPFVITSGTLMLAFFLPQGRLGTEKDVADAGSVAPRVASENAVLALAERGVRSSVVRLSPSVHDRRRGGFAEVLIAIAREKGVSGYVGNGSNRWPAVHQLDAARLFRLALEKAPVGSVLHGVAEEGVPTRTIAEVIGRHLDLPAVSISPEDAGKHFSWLGLFSSVDNVTSSALTRERLRWQPVHPTLIQDLEEGHFFDNER
ncbi:putative NAD-dependent epimerase/dehydratase [Ktedonobacter sp. SOSP1-52]|uniref:SDR family oxidoreductase n=1 Tax=Ktedonobacter sp. SOSP1-52 TaxID=2778366 RepID=UPI001916B22F|nr:SDR family oxidoreductase [Ktedonobacter sp. SOSP1-52]GHO71209.1 putative NAD-dependent epimerase/dehydratase [Ktedonobacter sp. SOSP1-52]